MPHDSPAPTQPRFTVGVTADRRGGEQELMFTRLGMRVIRGSALATQMVVDSGPLRRVTEELVARPADYLVANTGIGIRSWFAAAASWGLEGALVGALRAAHIAARGPKAVGAVRSAGLEVAWRAPSEQLDEVLAHLLAEPIGGCLVAVQLHGADHESLRGALEASGAEVIDIPVYRWAVPDDCAAALRLIEATCEGEIDAVTFTSAPAIRNLFALARSADLAHTLLKMLNGSVLTACVGPVCAGAARGEGIESPRVPEHWRLGSLVRLVADELERHAAPRG